MTENNERKQKILKKFKYFNKFTHYDDIFINQEAKQAFPLLPLNEFIAHQVTYSVFTWVINEGQLELHTNHRLKAAFQESYEEATKYLERYKKTFQPYESNRTDENLETLIRENYKIPPYRLLRQKEKLDLYKKLKRDYNLLKRNYPFFEFFHQHPDHNTIISFGPAPSKKKLTFYYTINFSTNEFMKDLSWKGSQTLTSDDVNTFFQNKMTRVYNANFIKVDPQKQTPHLIIRPFRDIYSDEQLGIASLNMNDLFDNRAANFYINETSIQEDSACEALHEIGHFLGLMHPFTTRPDYVKEKYETDKNYKNIVDQTGLHCRNITTSTSTMSYHMLGSHCMAETYMPVTQATLDEKYGKSDPFPQTSGQVIFKTQSKDKATSASFSTTSFSNDKGEKVTTILLHMPAHGVTLHNPSQGELNILDLRESGLQTIKAVFAPNGHICQPQENVKLITFSLATKLHKVYMHENAQTPHNIIVDGINNIHFEMAPGNTKYQALTAQNQFHLTLSKDKSFDKHFHFQAPNRVIVNSLTKAPNFHFFLAKDKNSLICTLDKTQGDVQLHFENYFQDAQQNYALFYKKNGQIKPYGLPAHKTTLTQFSYE